MSEHVQIVRDYICLRNLLAKSNPQPNMEFEIHFKVEGSSLMAFNTYTKAKIELARIQPHFFSMYVPHYGSLFEAYSQDLVVFINRNLNAVEFKDIKVRITELAHKHKRTLNLGSAYEPLS